jgi:hypothetical protein
LISEIAAVAAPIAGDHSEAILVAAPVQGLEVSSAGDGLSGASTGVESSAPEVSLNTSDPTVNEELPDSPLWGENGEVKGGTVESQNSSYGYGGYGGYGDLSPPSIINFTATQIEGGAWKFTGEVIDDDPVAGLTVEFGFLLEGYSTSTREDGTFEFVRLFSPGTTGVVSAIATDIDGLESEEVQCVIW